MKKAAETFATDFHKKWTESGTPPQDLIDKHQFKLISTEDFQLSGAKQALTKAGNSPKLLEKLQKAKKTGLLTPSPTYGGWIVANVDNIELPDEKAFEQSRSSLKTALQIKFLNKYQESIRNNTTIENRTAKAKGN